MRDTALEAHVRCVGAVAVHGVYIAPGQRVIERQVREQLTDGDRGTRHGCEKISRPLLGLCCVLSAAARSSVSEATR